MYLDSSFILWMPKIVILLMKGLKNGLLTIPIHCDMLTCPYSQYSGLKVLRTQRKPI